MKPELDVPSGQETTGHEWDGIKELNTPVPKAFKWWLGLSIAVCIPMWMLYPAWPYVSDYTKGFLGYSSREKVAELVAEGQSTRDLAFAAFANEDIEALAQDETLEPRFADAIGVLYKDNCAACHGLDLKGQTNFPNLTDDHWLWSGSAEEIEWTLLYGINAGYDDTRYAQMPSFGRDELLEQPDIDDVTEYVLSISGQDHNPDQLENGALVFEENCASCHNDAGIGELENGAPSLVDQAWIYGGSREKILETLEYGRQGVMPGWSDRLSPEEIRMLTLYVQWAADDDPES